MIKKMVQSTILSSFLLLGAVAPIAINLPMEVYAAPGDNAKGDDISTIGSDVTVGMSDNGSLQITGANSDVSDGFKAFLQFIRLLSGGGALVMLMIFVLNFIKLGAAGTNSKARADAISALIWSGIATACLSMSTVVFFFFFKMKDNIGPDTSQSTEKA